jgi:hypothetical protein
VTAGLESGGLAGLPPDTATGDAPDRGTETGLLAGTATEPDRGIGVGYIAGGVVTTPPDFGGAGGPLGGAPPAAGAGLPAGSAGAGGAG